MTTHVALADVSTGEYQNAQELAAIWGDVATEFEEVDCDLVESYILLGGYDVLFLVDAPSEEALLEASIAVQRYGIRMKTMEAMDFERLGEVVNDV